MELVSLWVDGACEFGEVRSLSKQLIEEMWFAVSAARCKGGVG